MADELYASAAIKADSSRAAIEVLYRELDVCLNKRLSADFLSFNLKNRLSDNSFSLHQNGLDDSIVTEANDKAKALGQPITPELMANLRCEEKRLLTLKKVRESVDFLMARRERILSERATLNDTDPERFRIPGRLLREEKTRAMVAELPAVATRLRKLSLLIEAGTGRPVLFDGERLDELLDRFEKDEAERKERDRAALERRRVGRVSGGVGNVRREEVFKTPTKKFGGRVPQSLVCGKSRKRVDGEEKNGEEGASVAQRAKTPDGKRRVRAVFSVPISLK